MTLTMIDYGSSNMRSAFKAFEHVGATVTVTSAPEAVLAAKKLVLPGVGAFGAGMRALRERALTGAIKEVAKRGTPLLGICVGMQFLFDSSAEMGLHAGLGIMPGNVVRFSVNGLKVPHMGWNQIVPQRETPLLKGVSPGTYTYFVHSYHCVPADAADLVATSDYGGPFAAVVQRQNVYGIQFHPEKSQRAGLQILENFVRL